MTTSTTQTEPYDISNLDHLRKLSASLNTLRQNTTLTDVTVDCGGRKFPAHRLVLTAVSPFFRDAFENDSKIVLPDISAQSMETILEFLYRGKLQDIKGSDDDMAKLLEASNALQLEELIKFSYGKLADRHLNETEFYEVYDLVYALENKHCLVQTVSFLAKNFTAVSKSKDFLLLRDDMLKTILECEDLYLNPAEDVIAGLLRWAQAATPRERHLAYFVRLFGVRCCFECLTHILEKNTHSDWSSDVIKEVHSLHQSRVTEMASDTARRKTLYCLGKNDEKHVMRVFDMEKYNWLPCVSLPFSLESQMATVSFGLHLYFFGGSKGMEEENFLPTNTVIQYCPFSNRQIELERNLPVSVFQAGAGVLDEIIYVINGRTATNAPTLRVVQCYNTKECTWRLAASTHEPHCMPYAFSFNRFLYIMGSFVGRNNCMERYDPVSDQWTIVTTIPGGVCYQKAAFCDTRLFVVQEYNETEYHVYEFFSKVWVVREFKGRPERIKGLWSINKDGKSLLLICDSDNVLHTCEEESGHWVEPRSQPREDSCNLWYLVQG